MATFKFTGGVSKFKDKLVNGMVERGYDREFAEKTFSQLEGFGSYGFPESHAASFALIAYASSWMKCWHPDVFCASLLNAQPMGFYAPAQIVRDAREHGVEVRPVCVNASRWDCTLEPLGDERFAVRLELRMVRGLANKDGASLVTARGDTPFSSVDDLWRRAKVPVSSLVELADADAMKESLGLARRRALWAIKALRDEPLELWTAAAEREARTVPELDEPDVAIRPMTAGGEVVEDYRHVGLSLRRHPVEFLRADLTWRRIVTCAEAMAAKDGRWLEAAGLVLVRQRPGSAKGVMFIAIEDETGVANLVVWPSVFERQRRIVLSKRAAPEKPRHRENHDQPRLCRPRSDRSDGARGVLFEPDRFHPDGHPKPARTSCGRRQAVHGPQEPGARSEEFQPRRSRSGASRGRDAAHQRIGAGDYRPGRHARSCPRHHCFDLGAGGPSCHSRGQGRSRRQNKVIRCSIMTQFARPPA
jgi:error-prone DNA polymerase